MHSKLFTVVLHTFISFSASHSFFKYYYYFILVEFKFYFTFSMRVDLLFFLNAQSSFFSFSILNVIFP